MIGRIFLLNTREHGVLPMSDLLIHKLIMKQSKESDYNWLASSGELLRVCNKPNFNKKYAQDIKLAIISCYSNLLDYKDFDNIINACQAFNELRIESKKNEEKDENIEKVCARFLDAFIFRKIFWTCVAYDGKSFDEETKKFRKTKIKQLLEQDTVNFHFLSENISREYKNYIDKKVQDGTIKLKPFGVKIVEEDSKDNHYCDSDKKSKVNKQLLNKSKKINH